MASKSTRAATKRGSYHKYTVKQRKAALRDAEKLGLSVAASRHGIPPSTLGNWTAARAKRRAVKRGRPAVEQKPDAAFKAKCAAPRVAKSYTPSQRAEILEYAAGHGVTDAHKKFEVSRFTIYDWRRKVERAATGQGASPTAGPTA